MHNESRFPVISQIARKYLAVPATSVPTERIFSTASVLVSKIHKHLQILWIYYYHDFLKIKISNAVTNFVFSDIYVYVHVFRWIKE
jgi:hypothetical protein